MTEPSSTREITLRRVYDAPREAVFALWTDAEHLARWWGPEGFSAPRVESDPRPGGALTIVMVGEGFEQTMHGHYREVVAPERLVVDAFVPGPDGSPLLESSHTVTFADLAGRTEVTVVARATVSGPEGRAALEGMQAGWNQSLQCLDDVVTGAVDRQVVLAHLYDAPPEVVFPYWVEPAHLERWWGPDGFTLTTHEHDLRPGGRWVFTMHGPDGRDYANTVTYREIDACERLVTTHGSPEDEDPPFDTVVTFDALAGRTVVTLRHVFASAHDRDVVVERFHADEGGRQTLARLAVLLGDR